MAHWLTLCGKQEKEKRRVSKMCPAPELPASREQEMFRYLRAQVTLHYVEKHAVPSPLLRFFYRQNTCHPTVCIPRVSEDTDAEAGRRRARTHEESGILS